MSSIIASHEIVLLCSHALKCYDNRLMDHGTRVAFLAEKIYNELELDFILEKDKIFLLSVFHDIGAYKTEEIDKMVTFETVDVDAHSIYGHLFTKYLTPLSQFSEVLLYHHASKDMLKDVDPLIAAYAQLVHIADRVDIGILSGFKDEVLVKNVNGTGYFDEKYILALEKAVKKGEFDSDKFPSCVEDWSRNKAKSLELSKEEVDSYLEMIIYSMDFKSNVTMVHSVNTVSIAVFLAKHFGFNKEEIEDIYYAALVHDIGKIAIPQGILESKGRLEKDEMEIMRQHAKLTGEMLKGVFSQNVIDYAKNHHEKLNGSGYPLGLSADEIDLPTRIVAVADVLSALLGNRSYKTGYSWEKTIFILEDMASQFLLDVDVVNVVISEKEQLQREIERKAKPITDKYEAIHKEFKEILALKKEGKLSM